MATNQSSLRDKAAHRQSGRCYYCGLPMCTGPLEIFAAAHHLTIKATKKLTCTAEHLIPSSAGGRTNEANIAAAHSFCNQTRHRCKKPKLPAAYKVRVENAVSSTKWLTARLFKCSAE
jgi:5-methylcytosine-specific restriction endonuclease McrA